MAVASSTIGDGPPSMWQCAVAWPADCTALCTAALQAASTAVWTTYKDVEVGSSF